MQHAAALPARHSCLPHPAQCTACALLLLRDERVCCIMQGLAAAVRHQSQQLSAFAQQLLLGVVQQAQKQQQQQQQQRSGPEAAAAAVFVGDNSIWQDAVPASTVALLAGLCQKHRTAVASILMATAPLSLPSKPQSDLHWMCSLDSLGVQHGLMLPDLLAHVAWLSWLVASRRRRRVLTTRRYSVMGCGVCRRGLATVTVLQGCLLRSSDCCAGPDAWWLAMRAVMPPIPGIPAHRHAVPP
jgi:hypothetical protein